MPLLHELPNENTKRSEEQVLALAALPSLSSAVPEFRHYPTVRSIAFLQKIPQIHVQTSREHLVLLTMISAAEAIQIIMEHVRLLGTEKVPLLDACGRTLGGDIIARENVPAFANSSMDGFAVVSTATERATTEHPSVLEIVAESSAGNPSEETATGLRAVRVTTGGLIPRGADAVIPFERATELPDGKLRVTTATKSGQHVRARGEDVKKGDVVLGTGTRITAGSMGILAALGRERIRVYKRPRVSIIATGDELVDIDVRPGKGQIRNASSYTLVALVSDAGARARVHGIVPDNPKRLRKKIRKTLRGDVVLITGGVSVGKYDYVKQTLVEIGVDIKFSKVNIKPGMPLVFGVHGKTLVFGLPGNPVSTAVTFLEFVRPALLRMGGMNDIWPMKLTAIFDQGFAKGDGKRHYLRGIVQRRNGELHVSTTGTQSSGVTSSLAKANCLIVVPEEVASMSRGSSVEIELL